MGLIRKPQVRVIYAECNSPAAGSESSPGYLYDSWYDLAQDDITAGKDAALAGLGLSYAAGTARFTALFPVVISVVAQLTVDATPGGACTVWLSEPDYINLPALVIADPNTLGVVNLERVFAMQTGDWFALTSACANGTDTPLTYAALSIVRLV